MIAKSVMAGIIARQRKELDERSTGLTRQILASMPYLTDRALLVGGVRGSGRSTLLHQMLQGEYPQAWYTDFSDARLAGFDRGDFAKLAALVAESGKGILLLDKVDEAQGWADFVAARLDEGIKVVATVSFDTLWEVAHAETGQGLLRGGGAVAGHGGGHGTGAIAGGKAAAASMSLSARRAEAESLCRHARRFITRRIGPFGYGEFLEATRKRGGEEAIEEYLFRGAFPEACKAGRTAPLLQLYDQIISRDVLIAKGVRDRATLCRTALSLLASTGGAVTANALRDSLKIKSVSTVTEHMEHLQRAGLVAFVPILSDRPGRRAVNPRRVYAVDTALAAALCPDGNPDRERLFETLVYNHLCRRFEEIYYTSEAGGCAFVAKEEGFAAACVQACYDGEEPDRLQAKIDGLAEAMRQTGLRRGVIVTLARSEQLTLEQGQIDIVDADTFLSE